MGEIPSANNTRPEKILAKMFAKETGVEVPPSVMRMFIRSKWQTVAPLAHAIHDTDGEAA